MTLKRAAAAAGMAFLCAATPSHAQVKTPPSLTVKDPGNLYPTMVFNGHEYKTTHFFVTACGMNEETREAIQLVSQVYIGLPLEAENVRSLSPARHAEILRELSDEVKGTYDASFQQSMILTRSPVATADLFRSAIGHVRSGFYDKTQIVAGIAAAPPIVRAGCGLPEGYNADTFAADKDTYLNPPKKPGEPTRIKPGETDPDTEQSASVQRRAPAFRPS